MKHEELYYIPVVKLPAFVWRFRNVLQCIVMELSLQPCRELPLIPSVREDIHAYLTALEGEKEEEEDVLNGSFRGRKSFNGS